MTERTDVQDFPRGSAYAPAARLRANATSAERLLWSRLRGKQILGVRFRRQVVLGPYIVDFACYPARLVVEVDGGQHGEPWHRPLDGARDAWLGGQGFRVLRFWNTDVLGNLDGVCVTIVGATEAALRARRAR